jgi:hypothetical protein
MSNQQLSAEPGQLQGDIIAMTQEKLVETKAELAEKNDIQNAAIAEAMSRLFGNQEGLAKLGEVMANYVYDHHHLPRV